MSAVPIRCGRALTSAKGAPALFNAAGVQALHLERGQLFGRGTGSVPAIPTRVGMSSDHLRAADTASFVVGGTAGLFPADLRRSAVLIGASHALVPADRASPVAAALLRAATASGVGNAHGALRCTGAPDLALPGRCAIDVGGSHTAARRSGALAEVPAVVRGAASGVRPGNAATPFCLAEPQPIEMIQLFAWAPLNRTRMQSSTGPTTNSECVPQSPLAVAPDQVYGPCRRAPERDAGCLRPGVLAAALTRTASRSSDGPGYTCLGAGPHTRRAHPRCILRGWTGIGNSHSPRTDRGCVFRSTCTRSGSTSRRPPGSVETGSGVRGEVRRWGDGGRRSLDARNG